MTVPPGGHFTGDTGRHDLGGAGAPSIQRAEARKAILWCPDGFRGTDFSGPNAYHAETENPYADV